MTRMIHDGLANRQVVGGDKLTGQFKFRKPTAACALHATAAL
jgi:hypothetical protein